MRNGGSGAIEKSGPRACGSVERLTFERSSKFVFSVKGSGVVPVVVWGLDDDDDSDDDYDPYRSTRSTTTTSRP